MSSPSHRDSPCSSARTHDHITNTQVYRFYQRHKPSKLTDEFFLSKLEKALRQYSTSAAEEEQLMLDLAQKYQDTAPESEQAAAAATVAALLGLKEDSTPEIGEDEL